MSIGKFIAIFSVVILVVIGTAVVIKTTKEPTSATIAMTEQVPVEINLDLEEQVMTPAADSAPITEAKETNILPTAPAIDLPDANRIEELFNKVDPRLPIVETIVYKSRVAWQKGRPAWLTDYASHYKTSRHFIARSLNGKPDYLKQDVKEGDKFNVFRPEANFEFFLVLDSSRCKMWFYYLNLDTKEKTLLKTYQVGLGRVDSSKASGLLTPLGTYRLGQKVVIYKPETTGMHQGKKKELVTIFGTRWIPFDKEIENTTLPAKGFGIHGTPWVKGTDGKLQDNIESIGKYESDGCVRLATPDIEELYAIIITKPTTIEIVRDFSESKFVSQYK